VWLFVVQLSDVSELAAALKLVVGPTDMSSAHVETNNVGWAAELVDSWNAAQSSQPAAKVLKSSLQSESSHLQCGTFCKYYFVTFL